MKTPTPPAAGEAAHRSLPWFKSPLYAHTIQAQGKGTNPDNFVCVMAGERFKEANLDFIVRACNAYDSDQRKIKALQAQLDEMTSVMSGSVGRQAAKNTTIKALEQALRPFAAVADEYDKNCLDECRPEWGRATDSETEIVTGRGGKPLLSLHHFISARAAIALANSEGK